MTQTTIQRIIQVDTLGGTTPARVHRPTGTMFIDKNKFKSMNPAQRFYVMLHEAGHATLDTSNEDEADSFASEQYIKKGYPLSESVLALTRNLDFNKPGHRQRAINQLNRAISYDQINKNEMNRTNLSGIKNRAYSDPRFNLHFSGDEGDMNDFLGIGKKSRERKKERKDNKQQRKLEKIEARADAAVRKRGAGGGIMDSIGGIVGGIFGKKDDGSEMMLAGDTGAGTAPASNNKTYIIIGVVVLVVIVGVFFFLRKK